MSLVVFLFAYVIRRRLDRADHLAGDEVWRSWFHRWSRVEAGQEGSVWKGMMLVALPSLALAGALLVQDEGAIEESDVIDYSVPCALHLSGLCQHDDADIMPAVEKCDSGLRAHLKPFQPGSLHVLLHRSGEGQSRQYL